MNTLTLVLSEGEYSLDFVSAHASEFEAVEWVWGKMLCKQFTAWPVGGDRERADDVLFKDNVAELQLRPYVLPAAVAHQGGLGPVSAHQVWVKQDGFHGNLPWIVVSFTATPAGHNYALGELRRIEGKAGMIYTHRLTPMGQQIEEHYSVAQTVNRRIAEVRRAHLRNGTADMTDIAAYIQEKTEPCASCRDAKLPGILFPVAMGQVTDHAYVQKCDECDLFTDDATAAVQLGRILDFKVAADLDGRPYLAGITFAQAQEMLTWKGQQSPR